MSIRRKVTLTKKDVVVGSKCISNGCFQKILEEGDIVDIFNMSTNEGTTQQVGLCSWHHDEALKALRTYPFQELDPPLFESDEEYNEFLKALEDEL